jgi:hypothetical protein
MCISLELCTQHRNESDHRQNINFNSGLQLGTQEIKRVYFISDRMQYIFWYGVMTFLPTTADMMMMMMMMKVQALRFCTGQTAHRGSRGIALFFHDHCTRRGWGVSVTPWLLFTPRKDLVFIVQEAGWAQGPVWTGAENLASTRIQSLDCPARSQSLYRLSYPAHTADMLRVKLRS